MSRQENKQRLKGIRAEYGFALYFKARSVLERTPQHFKEYAETGLALARHSHRAGEYFFKYAPNLLKHAPKDTPEYANTGLELTRRDSLLGGVFFVFAPHILPQLPKEYRTPLLEATQRLARADSLDPYEFLSKMFEYVENDRPLDTLLINSIHDQADAQAVSQHIKPEYKKDFMDHCRRFY